MADVLKAQKLAAARKRLKEYQKVQSKQKNVKNDNEENAETTQNAYLAIVSSENVTPAESMTSSTHSAFDNAVAVQQNTSFNQENDQISLNNYIPTQSNASFFNKALFQQSSTENNHILSNYFDTISQNINTKDTFDALTKEKLDKNVDIVKQNIEYADSFEPVQQKENNMTPFVSYTSNENNFAIENINTISAEPVEYEQATFSSQLTEGSHKNVYSDMLPDRTKSECALPEATSNVTEAFENQNLLSNTESLRQLSSQLNSLIDNNDTSANINKSANELEYRNQELAGLLKAEQTKTDELTLQVKEYLTRIAQLESETTQIRNEHEAKLSLEVSPLQEQLDYHMKAFGILVGERTELQLELTQSQTSGKQKTNECQELQGRLKASRHRVSELEKEVNHLKSAKDNLDKYDQENNREFERLRLECNLLQEQFDEATEESSELKEKLNVKVNECLSLQNEIQEKNSQLSLSQLKLQQLTNGENVQAESQIEILNQQKIYLEQQISELTHTIKIISLERDQASQQYQQYVQQLNGQIQSLAEKLETKNSENEILANREQSLVKHIGELEKHLQQLQIEKQNQPAAKNDFGAEIKRLEDTISGLQTEKMEVEGKYQEEVDKRQSIENELVEKSELILELESQVEQLKDQPDATKLFATMESDKVAASRAVEQNQKLKEQLEELHDGFIKMSNSKLELTEKLQSEQHLARELSEKLTQSNSTVDHLHSVITTKDAQLTELHTESTTLQKQILQQNQVTDRLRHYEAQGNTSDYIQQELQQSKHTVLKLTAENETLRTKMEKLTEDVKYDEIAEKDLAIRKTHGEVDKVENNEMQKNESFENQNMKQITLMRDKIYILEKLNVELQEQIKELNQQTDETKDDVAYAETDENTKSETYINKEKAMVQLEERFKKTMIDVANITEEKQRLEHLVLQLQSETETIGEYVTLYQCQRAVLKEKALEKDEQLKRLSHDREEMKYKLEQLNTLIQRLVVENGIISKDVLLTLHHDSCKVENDVNKIKADVESKKENVVNGDNHDNNNVDGTAGKIIALLTEIKTSNLVQPGDSIQNFHPCPLCSGQLITV